MDDIILNHEGWHVVLSPFCGARIVSCDFLNQAILRPSSKDWRVTANPEAAACFPLVPFSNRIDHGKFSYEDRTVSIQPYSNAEAHALHGHGWTGAWEVIHRNKQGCALVYHGVPSQWPWPYRCAQEISLDGNTLSMRLILTNTGKRTMPAGLGFHPFFPDLKTASLSFDAENIWHQDEQNLPTYLTPLSDSENFKTPQALLGRSFDHCFTQCDRRAVISWSDKPYGVEMSTSTLLDYIVLYTPPHEDFFSVEPVSHMNNAVNWEGHTSDTGLYHLKPAEAMTVSMDLKIYQQT